MGRSRPAAKGLDGSMVILFTPHARTLEICCLTVDADAGAPARRSQLLLTAEDQTQEVRHETLRPLQRLPVSQAHGHDLLHRAEACRLNPVDASIALWGAPRGAAQQVGGRLDVSDEIVAAGEDVPGWAMGDPVLTHGNSFRPQGGLAQFTVQDPAHSSPHTS